MNFIELRPTNDMVVSPDAAWCDTEYRRVSCSKCGAILPAHWGDPIDLVVERDAFQSEDGRTTNMHAKVIWVSGIHLKVLCTTTLDALVQEGLACGRGKVSAGRVPLDAYISVNIAKGSRCATKATNPTRTYSPCNVCGRQFTGARVELGLWIARSDVGDRRVFADTHTSFLYVREDLAAELGDAIADWSKVLMVRDG